MHNFGFLLIILNTDFSDGRVPLREVPRVVKNPVETVSHPLNTATTAWIPSHFVLFGATFGS